MSSEALYEQYKDALRRGHVAALRGQLDEALAAYAEAARIAPERVTPHTSAGAALLRHGRPGDAVRQFEVALAMGPGDEAALGGRAQALVALGRRREAAEAFDVLAETQAGAGRTADAVDAARRGLELAEGRERRRLLERLIARLQASEPAEPGRLALERALRVLEGLAVAPAVPSAAAVAETPMAPAQQPGAGEAADTAPEPPVGHAAVIALAPPPAPAGVSLDDLTARVEAASDAGQPGAAAEALLDLGALHMRDGRPDAALDAYYAAVSFDPGSPTLHLALARLYADRGWDALAAEKLDLLERLARLDGDEAAAGVAAAREARR